MEVAFDMLEKFGGEDQFIHTRCPPRIRTAICQAIRQCLK